MRRILHLLQHGFDAILLNVVFGILICVTAHSRALRRPASIAVRRYIDKLRERYLYYQLYMLHPRPSASILSPSII